MVDHRETAKLLLKRGAGVNAVANIKTKDGRVAKFTALTMAKARGYTEMVQLLIEAGAKEDIVKHNSWAKQLYSSATQRIKRFAADPASDIDILTIALRMHAAEIER